MTVGMQPGEIERALARIELDLREFRNEARDRSDGLANQMTVYIGKLEAHAAKIPELERRLESVETKVDRVSAQANRVAGVGAMLAMGGSWLVSWFKH